MRVFQPHLISAILSEPWAIHEKAVSDYAPIIANILNKDVVFDAGEPIQPKIIAVIGAGSAGASAAVKSGSAQTNPVNIAVITIAGPLTKGDQYCGPAGMKSIGEWIQSADNDPNAHAIMLNIDSPGGSVAGTEELVNIVLGTKKSIVAFVDDMAASAAYWIASACDEIICNNTTAQVGSIGVVTSFMDAQPAMEALGYKFHVITAPQSINKVKMWQQLREGNYEEYKENVLRTFAQKFIDQVKANRPNVEESQLIADIFFAKDVVGSLIDSIGTFDSALNRTAELSNLQATFNSPNTNQTMIKPELKRLAKASGVDALESADGSISLTAEQAIAVEKSLEDHETANAGLQQQVTESSNQQARVTELEGQLQTANDRIAELEKKPGAESAAVTPETDADGADGAEEGFYARFHKLRNLKNN